MTLEIFTCEQGTDEWKKCRAGVVTASCFSDVLAKGQGKVRRTYMLKLIGERLTGEPAESFTNKHMERGNEMEAEARSAYQFMSDNECTQVGFLKAGDVGCSPDSLIGSDGMLEIKTKLPHLQLEVMIADKLPSEHKAQVQGALWVSQREWCDFVSYWPGLPLFIKRVHRDEEYIYDLESEVNRFLAEMYEIQEQLTRKYA